MADLYLPLHKGTDEEARVFLILKTSATSEEVARVLPDLVLNLSAHATDAIPQNGGHVAAAAGKCDLNSKSLSAVEGAEVVQGSGETVIIWKPTIHLSRLRSRLLRPAIYFTSSLTLRQTLSRELKSVKKDHLASFEPLPANVLEPLHFDPVLQGTKVYLPDTSITKVAPAPPQLEDAAKPVRGSCKRALPAVSAVFIRTTYSPIPDGLIACLHLDTSLAVQGSVSIQKLNFEVSKARVAAFGQAELPRKTQAGDENVMLYKIEYEKKGHLQSPVNISIEATVAQESGCQSHLTINWRTIVDLSQSAQSTSYKWSRPLSTGSSQAVARMSMPPHSRPTSSQGPPAPSAIGSSILFHFTAPPTVQVGTDFRMHISCRNQSTRTRRFSLVMQPRTAEPSRASVLFNAQASPPDASDTRSSVVRSFQTVPPSQRSAPSVIDLNPGVPIGPLPAGACFETDMKFRALQPGVLELGVLCIVDMDTRQTTTVRELPDVVALFADPTAEGATTG